MENTERRVGKTKYLDKIHGFRNDVNRGLQSLRAPLLVFITNTHIRSDPLVGENSEVFLFFLA